MTGLALARPDAGAPGVRVDGDTTVFLDRDGVINRRIDGDYVRSWADFDFLPGVLDALRELSAAAGPIVVVTNQRGVALGRLSEQALIDIHERMVAAVRDAGGRIDAVLSCTHGLADGCTCRKPAPGLILHAAQQVTGVDLGRAVMVGDSLSDIECARSASSPERRIGTVLVDSAPSASSGASLADIVVPSLGDAVSALVPGSRRADA